MDYAIEKFEDIVYVLAIGEGDVRSRLKSAISDLMVLDESHFPSELKKEWNYIYKSLSKSGVVTAYNGEIRTGSYENSLNKMRNSTGAKIADRIYEMLSTMKMMRANQE